MRRAGILVLAAALAGCPAPNTGKPPAGAVASKRPAGLASSGPGASAAPLPLPATALAGAVRLLVPRATLIANNGGGVISDNGGGVVSNNSGAIVANNGGNVVSNGGSKVVANNGSAYRLAQADAPVALALAEARVVACDAAGTPLKGADGQALAVTTDAAGRYRFASLPGQGVVLRVALGAQGLLPGGTLEAIAPRDRAAGGELAIDTTSSLGAAYVLGKYVQGKQETLDRLPAAAADRLASELNASGALASAPAYRAAELAQLVEGLRGKAQALDQALEAIRALLLGQVGGGDGRQAAAVAIAGPRGFVRLADGRLMIGERSFGRVRSVAPDGTVGTYVDGLRGTVKRNFARMADIAGSPDGTLYVAAGAKVWKVDPAGQVTAVAGGADGTVGAVDVPATATTLAPATLALGPDGTLYVGEERFRNGERVAPRLLAIGADGILRQLPFDPADAAPGRISGLHVTADGRVLVLKWRYETLDAKLVAYKPGAAPVVRFDGVKMADIYGGVAEAPGGGLYVSLFDQLVKLAPDGTRTVLAGRDGPPALARKLRVADSLFVEPDGTLLIGDAYYNVVHALRPDGTLGIRAGTTSAVVGGDLGDVALASPGAVAFGPDGRLVIAPRDGRELEIFRDGKVTAALGEDAPADVGAVGYPSGLAYRGADLYVLDEGNHRLLKVAADGAVTKLAGHGPAGALGLDRAERRPAANFPVKGSGLVLDAAGRPYWVSVETRQVYRLAADGMVELVAGKQLVRPAGVSGEATAEEVLSAEHGDGGPAKDAVLIQPNGLAFDLNGDLLVADTALGTIKRITGLDGPEPTIERLYGCTPAEALAQGGADAGNLDALTDPAKAPIYAPFAIMVAPNGDRYVTELGTVALELLTSMFDVELAKLLPRRYARVRRITRAGVITTVAGPGSRFFADPTGPDGLITPMALALSADGRLAICDNAANLVRVLPAGTY